MKKSNSSIVWKYFDKIPEKPNEATCRLCKSVYKHGHGTSNLHEHLKRAHQSKLDADSYHCELEKDLDLEFNPIPSTSSGTYNEGNS